MNLFDIIKDENLSKEAPLAERMKPRTLDDFVGQDHILGQDKLLRRLIKVDKLSSIILHGPTGTGKTSLARIIANTTESNFETLNAVTSGVKDLREMIAKAESALGMYSKKTILFIDEIHRFNKAQQDALLPHVEKGTVTLIGATTENPYFEVNNALLSRSMVFKLELLSEVDLKQIIRRSLADYERGLAMFNISIAEEGLDFIARKSAGDARKALNAIELAVLSTEPVDGVVNLTGEVLEQCIQSKGYQYDKSADNHYDIASAFIKSMRGSDPDAAVHYLARMLHGGEDPKFVARRIVIAASEDVGNADPNALVVATNAATAVNFIGMPEARIILSQAATYVATAPKSNAAYVAINKALGDVEALDIGQVPYYLKDGTSKGMEIKKQNLKVEDYKYPHAYPGHYVEQQYLPDNIRDITYYHPTGNGYEKIIRERQDGLGTAVKTNNNNKQQ